MSGLDPAMLALALISSLIWAPIMYYAASALDKRQPAGAADGIWRLGLGVALLPALLTPVFSAAGWSLRAPAERPASPPVSVDTAPLEQLAPPDAELMIASALLTSPATAGPAAAALTAPPTTPDMDDAAAHGFFARIAGAPGAAAGEINAARRRLAAAFSAGLGAVAGPLLLLYAYGAALALALWASRSFGFLMTASNAVPLNRLDHEALNAAAQTWRKRLGVSKPVALKGAANIHSVCVYGLFRQVILIPHDLLKQADFDDLTIMIAHEMAHVKRGDAWVFAANSAVSILFWFNPAMKALASRAALAAEQGADDAVVQAGVARRDYAACFVAGLRFAAARMAEPTDYFSRRVAAHRGVPSFTPWDRKGRRRRLETILRPAEQQRSHGEQTVLSLAAALAMLAGLAQAAVLATPAPVAPPPVLVEWAIDAPDIGLQIPGPPTPMITAEAALTIKEPSMAPAEKIIATPRPPTPKNPPTARSPGAQAAPPPPASLTRLQQLSLARAVEVMKSEMAQNHNARVRWRKARAERRQRQAALRRQYAGKTARSGAHDDPDNHRGLVRHHKQALDHARADLQAAKRETRRSLNDARRAMADRLLHPALDDTLLFLSDADGEEIRDDLEQARQDMRAAMKRRLEALKSAQAAIARHEAELDRLRKAPSEIES